jgi:hypothetical protein
MSTHEIKEFLYESIENIDDADFLEAIKYLIERKYTPKDSREIPVWQSERINASRDQIKNGQSFSNRQADLLVSKWLSE